MFNKKSVLFYIVGWLLCLFISPTIFAVTSNPVITAVGNPPADQKPKLGSTAIVDKAAQIKNLLSLGPNNECIPTCDNPQPWFNVKSDEPGVYYFCQFLVVDSYNAAGFNDLNRNDFRGFSYIKNFFQTNPKYKFLNPEDADQVKPGAVAIFGGDSMYHVSVVYLVDIKSNGDGIIKTYDSNNVVKEDVISVVNHRATTAAATKNLYSTAGFGQPKNL